MRPSAIKRSSARRPTSRRTGSKHQTTTVSGRSSMITSTRGEAGDLLEARANVLLALVQRLAAILELLLQAPQLLFAGVDTGDFLVEAFVEVFAHGHQLFFGRQHQALARFRCAVLDAPSPHIEDPCSDQHAA